MLSSRLLWWCQLMIAAIWVESSEVLNMKLTAPLGGLLLPNQYPTTQLPACVSSCGGVPDGDYPSCEGCLYFTTCSNGHTFPARLCSWFNGIYWDDERKRCGWDQHFCFKWVEEDMTGPTCVKTCDDVEDGDYQSCEQCGMYASCIDGHMYDARPCPDGLLWDDDLKACQYGTVTCKERQMKLMSVGGVTHKPNIPSLIQFNVPYVTAVKRQTSHIGPYVQKQAAMSRPYVTTVEKQTSENVPYVEKQAAMSGPYVTTVEKQTSENVPYVEKQAAMSRSYVTTVEKQTSENVPYVEKQAAMSRSYVTTVEKQTSQTDSVPYVDKQTARAVPYVTAVEQQTSPVVVLSPMFKFLEKHLY